MSDNLDKIKLKIKALLAKANDTSVGVEEAKTFNEGAYKLMEKYNLERAQVEDATTEAARTHKELKVLVRPWATSVLAGLSHLYFCKWFYKPDGRSHIVTIIGEESNAAICHAMAVMILRAVQQEAKSTGGGRSFMTGAGSVIHRRCYEMRPANRIASAAPGATGTNALVVLADKEASGNTDYMASVLGIAKLRSVKSKPRINSSSALDAGRRFGESVPLTNRLLG